VQAMLNEDTYVPFPYFYDVTAWSQPLLYDVGGGYSGVAVPMATEAVGPVPDPGVPAPPAGAPSIALYSMSPQFTRGIESSGWLRWLLDRWGLAYDDVSAADIAGGALAGHDVLLVPDGYATRDLSVKGDPYALKDLGPAGQAAIRDWVRGGGRYVGWLDGAVLAAAVGVSSAQLSDAGAAGISSPGALIRAVTAGSSPLLAGTGPSLPTFWDSRYVVQGPAALVPLRYPAAGSDDFFVSGYADGAAALGGSAAIVDEPVGQGRTVAFGFEPNFRAFTDGTQTLLRNAILGADPAPAATARIASVRAPARAKARAKARKAARALRSSRGTVRLVVRRGAARSAKAVLRAEGRRYRVVRGGGRVTFLVGGGRDRSGDEHPWARTLEGALRDAGVRVVMFRAP